MDFLTQEIDAFADTIQLCDLSPTLKKSVKYTKKNQKVILYDVELDYPVTLDLKYATSSTYKSAVEGIQENAAVLQFISPFSPTKTTTLKQYEDLACDCTIYPCLTSLMDDYFDEHEGLTTPYNRDCIYSPEVTFFKRNGTLVVMPKWKKAAVISTSLPDEVNEEIIYERIVRMMEIAKMNHHTQVLINTITNADLEAVYQHIFSIYENDFYSIDLLK